MFASNKAAFRVVLRGSLVYIDDLVDDVSEEEDRAPLSGYVGCPKGCGSRLYWVLAASLSPYKEDFLIYLNPQLSWTPGPEHNIIERQRLFLLQQDWSDLQPLRVATLRSGRVVNTYE